jgi:hypothetical protein
MIIPNTYLSSITPSKSKTDKYSPKSVVKPGVTCSGMGRMSCECFKLRHTSWYFVYDTTADPCFDHRRQLGVSSSSLCSTTENCKENSILSLYSTKLKAAAVVIQKKSHPGNVTSNSVTQLMLLTLCSKFL